MSLKPQLQDKNILKVQLGVNIWDHRYIIRKVTTVLRVSDLALADSAEETL